MCRVRIFVKCTDWADEDEVGEYECEDPSYDDTVADMVYNIVRGLDLSSDVTIRLEVSKRR